MRHTALGWLLLSAAATSVSAADSLHAAMHITPGLWEFIETPKVSGDTVLPDASVAHVPAAQRAQFLTDMRKQMAAPQKVRECVTQAKFEQQLFSEGTGCTRTVVSNTPSRIEIRTSCRQDGAGTRNDTEHRVVASPTAVTGTMHVVAMRDGKTMTVDQTENGRWLSASCGNVKDIEIEP